jgi:predicted flap endonuclease-1-like 5' DNA nuclease
MINQIDITSQLSEYIGVFYLMLSTFLIGYFSSLLLHKSNYDKTIDKLKQKLNSSKSEKKIDNIDTIFSEIKPRIIKVVKETQNELQDLKTSAPPEKIMNKARSNYLSYTKSKPQLKFDNFGLASYENRNDLTVINGIGPYIEQKLNEIGIYNFKQIGRFSEEDIRTITELIDFFPGRIDRDNWVAQASALNVH